MHSIQFSAIHAAHEWKLRPSELGLCSPDEDIIYMVAYLQAFSLMERIEVEYAKQDK